MTPAELIERDHALEHAYTRACNAGDLSRARELGSEWSTVRASILQRVDSPELWAALVDSHAREHVHMSGAGGASSSSKGGAPAPELTGGGVPRC